MIEASMKLLFRGTACHFPEKTFFCLGEVGLSALFALFLAIFTITSIISRKVGLVFKGCGIKKSVSEQFSLLFSVSPDVASEIGLIFRW